MDLIKYIILFSIPCLFFLLFPVKWKTNKECEGETALLKSAGKVIKWTGSRFIEEHNQVASDPEVTVKSNPVTGKYEVLRNE